MAGVKLRTGSYLKVGMINNINWDDVELTEADITHCEFCSNISSIKNALNYEWHSECGAVSVKLCEEVGVVHVTDGKQCFFGGKTQFTVFKPNEINPNYRVMYFPFPQHIERYGGECVTCFSLEDMDAANTIIDILSGSKYGWLDNLKVIRSSEECLKKVNEIGKKRIIKKSTLIKANWTAGAINKYLGEPIYYCGQAGYDKYEVSEAMKRIDFQTWMNKRIEKKLSSTTSFLPAVRHKFIDAFGGEQEKKSHPNLKLEQVSSDK